MIGFLQETKLTGGIHMCYSAGYRVWAMEVESHHRGGVPIIWQEEVGCRVEVATNYGLNVLSFKIMVGWKRWYVFRAYVPPNNQPTVHRVEQALLRFPEGM